MKNEMIGILLILSLLQGPMLVAQDFEESNHSPIQENCLDDEECSESDQTIPTDPVQQEELIEEESTSMRSRQERKAIIGRNFPELVNPNLSEDEISTTDLQDIKEDLEETRKLKDEKALAMNSTRLKSWWKFWK